MTIQECENQYLQARKKLKDLDRSKFTENQLFYKERYVSELYFDLEGMKMELEKSQKEGYEKGKVEAQIMMQSLLSELMSKTSNYVISEKYQVEVAFINKVENSIFR